MLYLFAAMVLTSPVENPPVLLAPALQKIALEWELLDKREIAYILANPKDFTNDVKLLQVRYHDLKDAPSLSECNRLPDNRHCPP